MTFSIIAKDSVTGQFGVAVQSHWFSVGSMVCWARAGIGAVATQAMIDVSYGPLGLDLMSSGKNSQEVLKSLLQKDPFMDVRQVAMIDSKGEVAVHTGTKCIRFAGHYIGKQFACQANIMRNETVWPAMARAYEDKSEMEFPERLVSCLEAGERAGGDIRGSQSASLLIVMPERRANTWAVNLVDLQVQDHPDPIAELKRLLVLHRAYEFANRGDMLLSSGKGEEASLAYKRAAECAPHIDELHFWQGASLAQAGKVKEAIEVLRPIVARNRDWLQVLEALSKAGILPENSPLTG